MKSMGVHGASIEMTEGTAIQAYTAERLSLWRCPVDGIGEAEALATALSQGKFCGRSFRCYDVPASLEMQFMVRLGVFKGAVLELDGVELVDGSARAPIIVSVDAISKSDGPDVPDWLSGPIPLKSMVIAVSGMWCARERGGLGLAHRVDHAGTGNGEITSISYSVTQGDVHESCTFVLERCRSGVPGEITSGTELELISGFMTELRMLDPDVIASWELPGPWGRIQSRVELLGCAFNHVPASDR